MGTPVKDRGEFHIIPSTARSAERRQKKTNHRATETLRRQRKKSFDRIYRMNKMVEFNPV
jgi:hypothetical protein